MKTKSKKSPSKAKAENKPTLVAFLLDRSGSMQACHTETIKGFNGYIDELIKGDTGDMRFTLTQFDTIGIDVLHDAVPLAKVKRFDETSYKPRGGTPLHDAVGKTIRATEKLGKKYKVLFVTLTDGQENSSSEWTRDSVAALMKEKEDQDHWTFAHIGVGVNGWEAVRHMAQGTQSISNVLKTDHKNTKKTYMRMASMTQSYCANAGAGGQSVNSIWSGSDDKQS